MPAHFNRGRPKIIEKMKNTDLKPLSVWLVAIIFWSSSSAAAQNLPLAFPTGDHLEQVEGLYNSHPVSLIEACGWSIDSAGLQWLSFLEAIEQKASTLGVDLRGVRLVLTVFFQGDGQIKHLGFARQVTSRNIREEILEAFFRQFANEYRLEVGADSGFFHEGPAIFPLRPERIGG